jgi:coenzyme PQQ precursor peptide PqqA
MLHFRLLKPFNGSNGMAWTTPELVEVCIGMEINAYAPAEF